MDTSAAEGSFTLPLPGGPWDIRMEPGTLVPRLDRSPGGAQDEQGIGIVSFLTALATALVIFTVQASLFMLLRNKLARIL